MYICTNHTLLESLESGFHSNADLQIQNKINACFEGFCKKKQLHNTIMLCIFIEGFGTYVRIKIEEKKMHKFFTCKLHVIGNSEFSFRAYNQLT